MAVYSVSSKGDRDIANIYEYGILTFGLIQAKKYIYGLRLTFEALAERPEIGSRYHFLYDKLYRFPYKSHVIFYQKTEMGIRIIRILGS